jgi:Tol biopolymer transport system component
MVAEFQTSGKLNQPNSVGEDRWQQMSPQWTHDGYLIFSSNPQASWGIYRVSLDTQETKPLVSGGPGPIANLSPVPTFDGKWLLYNRFFTEDLGTGSVQLMRVPLDGGPATPVFSGRFSYECASAAAVCVLSELNKQQRSFSLFDPLSGRGALIAKAGISRLSPDYGWSLSPDGRNIAFIPESDGPYIEILSVDRKNSPTKITSASAKFQSLSWSANNQRLYATNASDSGFEILAVNLDGTYKLLWKPNDGSWIVGPKSSPDGRFLAYQKRTFHANITMLENY